MESLWPRIEPLLWGVAKPARYIGGEQGARSALRRPCDVAWLLIYPDTYEIGLPNQGLQILYEILNDRPDAVAERSYAPWLGMEAGMPVRSAGRDAGDPLVVAGGHCTFNPEPLADFVDAFVLGDGEEVVREM